MVDATAVVVDVDSIVAVDAIVDVLLLMLMLLLMLFLLLMLLLLLFQQVTKEDMEAYRLTKANNDDPLANLSSDVLLEEDGKHT